MLKIVYFLIIISISVVSLDAVEKKKPNVFNTTSEYSRLCEESDIYGLWKVVRWIPYIEVKGKMWETPAFMKNQWFDFDGKGGMRSLSINKEMKQDDVKRKISESSEPIKISFSKKGYLRVGQQKKGTVPQKWRCSLVEKEKVFKEMSVELKKGDLIMTLMDEENKILYFRQLRRVENEK